MLVSFARINLISSFSVTSVTNDNISRTEKGNYSELSQTNCKSIWLLTYMGATTVVPPAPACADRVTCNHSHSPPGVIINQYILGFKRQTPVHLIVNTVPSWRDQQMYLANRVGLRFSVNYVLKEIKFYMHKERWTYGKFNSHEPFSNGVRGNDQSDIFRTINPRSDSKQQLATDDVNS